MKPLPQILLLIVMILTISCSSQPSQENSQTAKEIVDRFLDNPSLASASVGIVVADAETGKVFAAHNSGKSLVPASIQKLLVSAAALETFGTDYVFTTTVYFSGNIDQDGSLHGDIIIHGGGDPAFGSERFKTHYGSVIDTIADAVRKAGIIRIEGNIIGDESYFRKPQIPDSWIWEDIGNYYGSPAFGLNIFENTYRLAFSSGAPGSLTRITGTEPQLHGIEFENFVKAAPNNRDNAYIFGSYLSPKRELRGSIPANRESFSIKGAIPDPALLAATLLREKLTEEGIPVSGIAESISKATNIKDFTKLVEIQSPPLAEIVQQLNTHSINLYAEDLLLYLAKAKKETVSVEAGCHALTAFWSSRSMDTTGIYLEDGSGLSRANALTPQQMAFLLHYMKNQSPVSGPFIASLPISGISGSLKNFTTEIPGAFIAKSGYMSRVMNYTGYLETASGRHLILVLMANNYTCSDRDMKKFWEAFVGEVWRSGID